jgi:hypothetical protein
MPRRSRRAQRTDAACYHVMNRGQNRATIFSGAQDRAYEPSPDSGQVTTLKTGQLVESTWFPGRDLHMKGCYRVIIILMTVLGDACNSPNQPPNVKTDEESLIDRLGELKVEGYSASGPYVAVGGNQITKQIISKGSTMVPRLLKRLAKSDYNESVFIVFCLRELRARDARDHILRVHRQLVRRERFKEPHDLTLEMQIRYFLADIGESKPKR